MLSLPARLSIAAALLTLSAFGATSALAQSAGLKAPPTKLPGTGTATSIGKPSSVVPSSVAPSFASRGASDLPQRLNVPTSGSPTASAAVVAPVATQSTPAPMAESVPPAVSYTPDFTTVTEPWPVRPYADETYADWTSQFLPAGLIYRAYLAGSKESRMATIFENQKNFGWIWDITLGGRVALYRYGTSDPIRPEGFEIDLEGSGQPRLNLSDDEDLIAADFRAGLPITYGIGRWQSKFAYYHLSSHLGDEYMLKNPGFRRVNYSRDCLVLGQSYYVTDDIRLYGEVGWAFYSDVSEPWELQFGIDYSPLMPIGGRGAPFAAVNGQLRQELNFSGNFVAQAGWQWRGGTNGQLVRIGMQYYNGLSNQYQLYNFFENKIGLGIWYDY